MANLDSFVFDEVPTQEELVSLLVNKARKPKIETRTATYGLNVRRTVRGLWKGYFDISSFINVMALTIRAGFTQAWHDGMATCGMKPQDMSILDRMRLQQEINTEISYVANYALAIRDNDQIAGGKLTPLMQRSQMWGLRYQYIYDLARTYACADQKLKWQINLTRHVKESCDDCLMLNGKVYKASEWRLHDVSPKMHRLKCGGYHCGCGFVVTTDPVSTVPFPVI